MPISKAPITGRVVLSNDTAYSAGVLTFILSEPDTELTQVIPGGTYSVALTGDSLPADVYLWRNTSGVRGTFYKVVLSATITTDLGNGQTFAVRKDFALGSIQVGAAASYTLADLLRLPVGDATDWARQVRFFNTLAEFQAWNATSVASVGLVVFVEALAYRYIGSGTAVVGLPGWVSDTIRSPEAIQAALDAVTASTAAAASATAAQTAANNAQASARTSATWAALAALTGTVVGQGAEVLDTDAGTHTDPVIGGTVANAGRYTWSTSPAGWRWIGVTGLSGKASTTALNTEITDRRAVIKSVPASDTELLVSDATGFAIMRVNTTMLQLMGGLTFRDYGNGDFTIRDQAGFAMLSVSPTAFEYLGKPISASIDIAASLPAARATLDAIRRDKPRDLPNWRQARANAVAGLGRAKVLFLGDSNTAGRVALGTGSETDRRALSSPDIAARLLPPAWAATRENVTGTIIFTTALETFDPRLSIGAGWVNTGVVSIGGNIWRNNTTTGTLTFTPGEAWRTVDVYFALSAAASVSIGVSGSMTTYTPATGSIVKVTYTAPTSAIQALVMTRISGDVQIIGWDCYRAGGGVSIVNGARSGSTSAQIADATDWYSPKNAVAGLAPDLCVIQIGLNDCATGVEVATYKANVQSLATACLAAGSDVAFVISASPGGVRPFPWTDYAAAIYELGQSMACPVVDLGIRLGDYTTANAAGFMADTLHPNASGYAETAHVVAQLLTF